MNKKEIKKQLIKIIKKRDAEIYKLVQIDPAWKDGQKFNFGMSLRLSDMSTELWESIYRYKYNLDFIHEVHNDRFGEGYLIRFNRDKLGLLNFKRVRK